LSNAAKKLIEEVAVVSSAENVLILTDPQVSKRIAEATATAALPVAVVNFLGYLFISWWPLSAAASIITLPVLILALMVQKYIVQGLDAGGISG
jgi:ABC-type glycerol-3-phosphate transport system permease component